MSGTCKSERNYWKASASELTIWQQNIDIVFATFQPTFCSYRPTRFFKSWYSSSSSSNARPDSWPTTFSLVSAKSFLSCSRRRSWLAWICSLCQRSVSFTSGTWEYFACAVNSNESKKRDKTPCFHHVTKNLMERKLTDVRWSRSNRCFSLAPWACVPSGDWTITHHSPRKRNRAIEDRCERRRRVMVNWMNGVIWSWWWETTRFAISRASGTLHPAQKKEWYYQEDGLKRSAVGESGWPFETGWIDRTT